MDEWEKIEMRIKKAGVSNFRYLGKCLRSFCIRR